MWGFVNPTWAQAAGIDSAYKYAWSNMGGYVNFAPSQSSITVSDLTLTGYAWSANDGWINLSPSQGGVTNNGSGTLGGFAWDSSQGWVSFTGVTINTATGKFTGQATGANGYVLNFDCSTCDVRTDWRPVSAQSTLDSTGFHGQSVQPVPVAPTSPAAGISPSASSGSIGSVSESGSSEGDTVHPQLGQSTSPVSAHSATSAHTASTTKSVPTKNTSLFHAAIIPVGIVLLIIIVLFLVRLFWVQRRKD